MSRIENTSTLIIFVLSVLLAFTIISPFVLAQTTVDIKPVPTYIIAGQSMTITVKPSSYGVKPDTYIEKNNVKIVSLDVLCNATKCYDEKTITFAVPSDWQGSYNFTYTEYTSDVVQQVLKKEFIVVKEEGAVTNVSEAEQELKKALAPLQKLTTAASRYSQFVCSFPAYANCKYHKGYGEFRLYKGDKSECPLCFAGESFKGCNKEGTTRTSECEKCSGGFWGIGAKCKINSRSDTRALETWTCGSTKCPVGTTYSGRCEEKEEANLANCFPLFWIIGCGWVWNKEAYKRAVCYTEYKTTVAGTPCKTAQVGETLDATPISFKNIFTGEDTSQGRGNTACSANPSCVTNYGSGRKIEESFCYFELKNPENYVNITTKEESIVKLPSGRLLKLDSIGAGTSSMDNTTFIGTQTGEKFDFNTGEMGLATMCSTEPAEKNIDYNVFRAKVCYTGNVSVHNWSSITLNYERCIDECTIGVCINDSTIKICGNYDSDSCKELSPTPTQCDSGKVCSAGECVSPP